MTINNFIEAIATKLTEIWSDKNVYIDEIPKDADGHFFVGITESNQEKKLNNRYQRTISFEILYFLKSDDSTDFNDWAETMYDEFDTLSVAVISGTTRIIHLAEQSARKSESRVYQFTFDAVFYFVNKTENGEEMEILEIEEGLKNG